MVCHHTQTHSANSLKFKVTQLIAVTTIHKNSRLVKRKFLLIITYAQALNENSHTIREILSKEMENKIKGYLENDKKTIPAADVAAVHPLLEATFVFLENSGWYCVDFFFYQTYVRVFPS